MDAKANSTRVMGFVTDWASGFADVHGVSL